MNERQGKQTLEINTAIMGQTSRITHTIFEEMKDNTNNFGRQLETIQRNYKKKAKWKLKNQNQ